MIGGMSRRRVLTALLLAFAVAVALAVHLARDRRDPPHRVDVARHGLGSAQLVVAGGVDRLRVTTGAPAGALAAGTTPDGARAAPVLRLDGDRLTVTTRDAQGPAGPVELSVRLARDVRWTVTVTGGAQRMELDLGEVPLRSVDVRAGTGALDLRLPRPGGVLPVRVGGGAGSAAAVIPAGVPARVTFASGAGSAALDDDRRQGIAAGTTMTTPDWSGAAPDRVDVLLASGVGTLSLTRR
jgi:hypothetical protein